jgi:hypothetical protein
MDFGLKNGKNMFFIAGSALYLSLLSLSLLYLSLLYLSLLLWSFTVMTPPPPYKPKKFRNRLELQPTLVCFTKLEQFN